MEPPKKEYPMDHPWVLLLTGSAVASCHWVHRRENNSASVMHNKLEPNLELSPTKNADVTCKNGAFNARTGGFRGFKCKEDAFHMVPITVIGFL